MNKYITLVSSQDYLLAALTLHKSLELVEAQYPLVIAITDTIAIQSNLDILKNEGIEEIIILPTLEYTRTAKLEKFIGSKVSLYNTASKLALFNLPNEDKFVYLDADMYIRYNIDDIFNYPNGAILRVPEEELGMSTMFVFIPKYHDYRLYECLLKYSDVSLDGGIIGMAFFSGRENPDFQIPASKYFTQDVYLKEPGAAYHWHGNEKPFLMTPKELSDRMFFPAYQEYCKIYLPLKIKYPNL